MSHQLVSTDTPGERPAAFSRAVRMGNMVFVSGTTAQNQTGGAQHPGDAAGQATYVLQRIATALEQAGASLDDVVRTRIIVRDLSDADAVARAHARVFAQVRPANTTLHGEPLDPAMLVEIEADSVIAQI